MLAPDTSTDCSNRVLRSLLPMSSLVAKFSNVAEQIRTSPNKPDRKNLKKPEKTESRNRTIFSVLLNFVICSPSEKKFPENLKPESLSRSDQHAVPVHG